MTPDLPTGKILILGASGGIGRETAKTLTSLGHKLHLVGRSVEVSTLATQLECGFTQLGETSFATLEEAGREAVTSLGGLTGIVCCTGTLLLKPGHMTSEADLAQMINSHLIPAFASVRIAAKALKDNGGSVVFMSSAASMLGLPNHEAIAAMKGAINGLTMSAAASYARQNIRFNAVAPGLVATPMTAKITASEAALKTSLAMHGLKRIGTPADIARAVSFFVDPRNDWITGQIFAVDGGLSSVKLPVSPG